MVAGIIVTHGRLGEELIETAKIIYGDFADCYALTNDGKSPHVVFEEVSLLVRALEGQPCIVFVDFLGGSCCHACVRLKVERADLPVISGVNLPMLLAFLNKRTAVPFDRLPGEIIDRGHNSIQMMDPHGV